MLAEIETAAATSYDAFSRALRSRGPTLNLLFEQARVSPEREGDTILRDAFAVALVTVLHDMLRAYWESCGGTKTDWKRGGPKTGGVSVGQVLGAALDNARHFESWDAEKPVAMLERRSVKLLCAVLSIEIKKSSKHAPFRGNVCWPVLEALSMGGGYGAIEAKVRAFAASLRSESAR